MCAAIFGAVYYLGGWQPSPLQPAEAIEANWFDEALTTFAFADSAKYEALLRRAAAEPDHEKTITDRLDDLDPNGLMRMTEFVSDLSRLEPRHSYLLLLDACFHKLPQRWRYMALYGYANYPWSKVNVRVREALDQCAGEERVVSAAATVAYSSWTFHPDPEPEHARDADQFLRSFLSSDSPDLRAKVVCFLVRLGWMNGDEANPILDTLVAEHPEMSELWSVSQARQLLKDTREENSKGGG